MYGCNHGDWLVVRSLGEGCSVGMCQTDRGAHTHRRANPKPAVSLKTISYIIETTYKFQRSLGRGGKKGHFASSLFFFSRYILSQSLRAPGWGSQTLKWWIYTSGIKKKLCKALLKKHVLTKKMPTILSPMGHSVASGQMKWRRKGLK